MDERKGVDRLDLLLFLLAWGFLWAAGFLPPGLDDQARQRIESTHTLRVGLDPAYPPFENEVEGRLVGYDVDLARALGERLHLQVEFVPLGYDSLYDALLSGRIDVILSSYPYSPELCWRERCTRPYFQAGQMLVVRADSPISGPQDLAGRSVGVEWGGPGDVLVRRWEQAGKIGARQTFMGPQEALEALVAGEVDAVVVDRLSALAFAGREKIVLLEPPLQDESLVAVVLRRSLWLHRRLDQALYELDREGYLDELEARWCRARSP